MKFPAFVTAGLLVPALLSAQSPIDKGAASITEAKIRRGIEKIADDSMAGRDTPSPGLEKTAEWVASEFKRLGLKPGGEKGGYLQRYEVNVSRIDPDSSFFQFTDPSGKSFSLPIGPAIRAQGIVPRTATKMGVVLIGGRTLDSTLIRPEDVQGRLAVIVADWSQGMTETIQQTVFVAVGRGALGVLLPVNNDSLLTQLGFGTPLSADVNLGPPAPPPPPGSGRFFALTPEKEIVTRAPETAAQLAQLREAPTTVVTVAEGWQSLVIGKMAPAVSSLVPNTIGILEGSDPTLRNEYVVVSAHMDHVGGDCGGSTPADRICNGADDDASGTVGVVELAAAFSEARPKRSMIFLTVSGEEKGLWGSAHFVEKAPVPLSAIVADLNMDMIGRNWKDTIVAIGKEHSDLGATVDRIAAARKDLGLRVVDDLWPQENLYFRSDHFNFARRGVPVLFFTSGLHADYHAVTDSPEKIDAEKESRILKLIYYLGQEIANTQARPKWKPESYAKIVK